MGIAMVVIVAVVSLSVRSLENINFARNQAQANRFASEAIEWLRSEREANWKSLEDRIGSTRCMPTLSWDWDSTPRCDPNDPNNTGHQVAVGLWREVTLQPESATKILAQVKVFWSDSKGSHNVILTTRFTKWR